MKNGLWIVLGIIGLLLVFSAAGNDSYTASDLRDAQQRYYSGQYSREDERMVEGFNRWKADQGKYTD